MSESFDRLKAEGLLSLSAAARLVGVHPTSVARWCHKGAKTKTGTVVLLEYVRTPGRLLTSAEAVGRFLTALGTRPQPSPAGRSPAKVRRSSEEAARVLDQMGI